MVKGEFWITEADNGLIVKECDDEGVVISTVVYEGEAAPAKLGEVLLEYIHQNHSWDNEHHVKIEIV